MAVERQDSGTELIVVEAHRKKCDFRMIAVRWRYVFEKFRLKR